MSEEDKDELDRILDERLEKPIPSEYIRLVEVATTPVENFMVKLMTLCLEKGVFTREQAKETLENIVTMIRVMAKMVYCIALEQAHQDFVRSHSTSVFKPLPSELPPPGRSTVHWYHRFKLVPFAFLIGLVFIGMNTWWGYLIGLIFWGAGLVLIFGR